MWSWGTINVLKWIRWTMLTGQETHGVRISRAFPRGAFFTFQSFSMDKKSLLGIAVLAGFKLASGCRSLDAR